jgi:hypothetical protein
MLSLGGHTSRWNPKALEHLHLHNVHTMFVASKTSIWGQPNDNGINLLTHTKVDEVAKESRLRETQASDKSDHPFILVRA